MTDNYSIAQLISEVIGNSPISFESVRTICLEIYNNLGGEPELFDSIYLILLEILPLSEESASIDDSSILSNKTWSSYKINGELEEKQYVQSKDYLSLTYIGAENINTIYITCNTGNTSSGTYPVACGQYNVFQYSKDRNNWIDFTSGNISLNTNETVYFRGILTRDATLSTSNCVRFKTYSDNEMSTSISVGCVKAAGDLRSLNDYTGVHDDIVPTKGFYLLFRNMKSLLNTPKLTASTLDVQAYYGLFYECSNLTETSPILAKKFIGKLACGRMYQSSGLIIAPALPAVDLNKSCYALMFSGCQNLVLAPELPALLVPASAYEQMFANCTSLIIPPSMLPAKTIGDMAYYAMFNKCTSLTYSPDIMANDARPSDDNEEIYINKSASSGTRNNIGFKFPEMFSGCTSLSKIKCYIQIFPDNVEISNDVYSFSKNVAANGTFYIAKQVSTKGWSNVSYGIPTGWTVVEL